MTRPDIEAIKLRLAAATPTGKLYVRTGEGKDALSVCKDGRHQNGGWIGVQIAKMSLPNEYRTQAELNAFADIFANAPTDLSACLEYIERLEEENERLRKVEREANLLLTWTYQHAINVEAMPERGWWHVSDLHPGVYNAMNSAERDLYIALGGSELPAALRAEGMLKEDV